MRLISRCPPEGGRYKNVSISSSHTDSSNCSNRRNTMRNRRQFLKDAAGASAGMFFLGSGAYGSQPATPAQQAGKRREIRVGQRRVKTVDVHSHIALPEAAEV